MNKCIFRILPILTLVYFGFLIPVAAQTAIQGAVIYTMAGEPIRDGVVLVEGGKISAIGTRTTINIPANYQIIEAQVVTPGLIDAHATAGLTGIYNQPQDQDHQDSSAAIQPELRAIDAVNMQEKLIDYLRGFGITTIHTGHSAGQLVSGQTVIVKTTGGTVESAMLREVAAISATIGPAAARREGSPGTRGKQMSMLRQELIKAQEYAAKRLTANEAKSEGNEGQGAQSLARDLRLEALAEVLAGKTPLLITVNKAQDIATALRLAEEFGIQIWLDGAAEAYLLIDKIKSAGIPVILHPTMTRATGEYENLSFETAAKLVNAGIPVAMQSGYEGYVPKVRVVLFEAAITAANGLGFEQALATITIDAAKILGIADRVGSLEVGKDADIALYNGDPFEYTTQCTGVLVNGQLTGDPPR
ncbi:MAG: amidohydrolase family protein [Pirellulaceae bacterium]|nr:amidohydrolase family protein [Pirellulaceae bacterium]